MGSANYLPPVRFLRAFTLRARMLLALAAAVSAFRCPGVRLAHLARFAWMAISRRRRADRALARARPPIQPITFLVIFIAATVPG